MSVGKERSMRMKDANRLALLHVQPPEYRQRKHIQKRENVERRRMNTAIQKPLTNYFEPTWTSSFPAGLAFTWGPALPVCCFAFSNVARASESLSIFCFPTPRFRVPIVNSGNMFALKQFNTDSLAFPTVLTPPRLAWLVAHLYLAWPSNSLRQLPI